MTMWPLRKGMVAIATLISGCAVTMEIDRVQIRKLNSEPESFVSSTLQATVHDTEWGAITKSGPPFMLDICTGHSPTGLPSLQNVQISRSSEGIKTLVDLELAQTPDWRDYGQRVCADSVAVFNAQIEGKVVYCATVIYKLGDKVAETESCWSLERIVDSKKVPLSTILEQ